MITSDWRNNRSFYLGFLSQEELSEAASADWECPLRSHFSSKKEKKKLPLLKPTADKTNTFFSSFLFFFFFPFTIVKQSILFWKSVNGIKELTGLQLSMSILEICWSDFQSVPQPRGKQTTYGCLRLPMYTNKQQVFQPVS